MKIFSKKGLPRNFHIPRQTFFVGMFYASQSA